MILLGLHGRMGSGKDTAATLLKKRYEELSTNLDGINVEEDYDIKSAAFADPLKNACQILFGGQRYNYFGTQAEKAEPAPFWGSHIGEEWGTYRGILQQFGTNVMRHHVHPDFWVYSMQDKIQRAAYEDTDLFMVTDVRFPNEAKMIRELGGKVIHLVYTENKNPVIMTKPKWWQLWKKPEPHPSEKPLPRDLVDYFVETSTIQQLDSRLKDLMAAEIARNSTRRFKR